MNSVEPDAKILCGVYVPPSVFQRCVIICDDWPSWLSICATCGFICEAIYVMKDNQSTGWKTVEKMFSNWNIYDGSSLKLDESQPWDITTLVLIQGDHPTCRALFMKISSMAYHRALYVLPGSSPLLHHHDLALVFPYVRLTHAQCGGVLDGDWVVYFTDHFSLQDASKWATSPQRRIKHVVSQATAMSRVEAPAPLDDEERSGVWFVDSRRRCLHWGGLLPVTAPLTPLLCRSVFSSTGWTTRSLTVNELGHAFDVPTSVLGEFSSVHTSRRRYLPFIRAVPAKVLLFTWMQCFGGKLQSGGGIPSFSMTLSNQDGQDVPSMTVTNQDGQDEGQENNANVHKEIVPSAMAMSNPDGQEDQESDTKLVPDRNMKATKPDDAEVPIQLWDDRIWKLQLHCDNHRRVFEQRFKQCPLTVWRSHLICVWR